VEWDSLRSDIKIYPEYLAQFSKVRLGKGKKIDLDREEFINEFTIRVGAQTKHGTRASIPFLFEPYLISRLWEDKMNRLFFNRYEAPLGRWIPQGAFPTDTLLRKMMWDSDNFLAEQILLMVGRELTDSLETSAAIRAIVPDSAQIRWVDGSGLSRYNLLSPKYLVAKLDEIQKTVGWDGVQQYFPANGLQGTLEKRYTTKKQPYIYAKTGTLSNNYNLSGYILGQSGKWYIFSYMHNHFLGPTSSIQNDIEEVLLLIHQTL
jgi:D-alanyl-D-alanine carboxypeptidase/D-alanyl-D-alanine-endopeptidase (penicillin-binding protein 4)